MRSISKIALFLGGFVALISVGLKIMISHEQSNTIPELQWSQDTLQGKQALITGANTGLGYETARQLALGGANVVLACRSDKKCEAAANQIRLSLPEGSKSVVTPMHLDLADQESVKAFSEAFLSAHNTLDYLINNAGIMMTPYAVSPQGVENQFAINHLGHFALTMRLMPLLKATPGSRVINHSSSMSDFCSNLSIGDEYAHVAEEDYDPVNSYSCSKRANRYFTWSLNKRLKSQGSNVRSMACDPGWTATDLQHRAEAIPGVPVFSGFLNSLFAQSPSLGALPQLLATTGNQLVGGEVIHPRYVMFGQPEVKTTEECDLGIGEVRCDAANLEQLWDLSVRLTGLDL